jgi:hypothetical protein
MTLLELSRKARAIEERKNANTPVVVGVVIVALLVLTFLF